MTYDRLSLREWKDLASIAQSVLLSVAAVIASIWAIYSFRATQANRRAALELAQMSEVQSVNPLQAQLQVTQGSRQGKWRPVFVDLILTNRGVRPVVIDFQRDRLGLARVRHDSVPRGAASRISSPFIQRAWPESITVANKSLILLPGNARTVSYVFFVELAGTYLVDFEAPTSAVATAVRDSILRASGFFDSAYSSRGGGPAEVAISRFVEIR